MFWKWLAYGTCCLGVVVPVVIFVHALCVVTKRQMRIWKSELMIEMNDLDKLRCQQLLDEWAEFYTKLPLDKTGQNRV
jgi:hypothetical protein